MAEIRYTERELEAAKEYLRQRIRNEQSMEHDVEELLEEYAGYILHALFNGASESDIDLLIEDLIMHLMDDCRMLAVDEHDVDDETMMLIFGEGDTSVEERVRKRARTFLDEVTAVFSAGEILQMGESELLASVRENLEHPWDNEFIEEVRGMIERGEVEGDIEDFEEPHYGKGVPISSEVDIEFVTESAIAAVWTEWDYLQAVALGAKGYYIERGSSYPCEECESHTGVFHPISDHENLPQYHRSCRCFVVYCYENEMVL